MGFNSAFKGLIIAYSDEGCIGKNAEENLPD